MTLNYPGQVEKDELCLIISVIQMAIQLSLEHMVYLQKLILSKLQ